VGSNFQDDCEHWINICGGKIVFQSLLEKIHIMPQDQWNHLYSLIEDAIIEYDGHESIVWEEVWENWER